MPHFVTFLIRKTMVRHNPYVLVFTFPWLGVGPFKKLVNLPRQLKWRHDQVIFWFCRNARICFLNSDFLNYLNVVEHIEIEMFAFNLCFFWCVVGIPGGKIRGNIWQNHQFSTPHFVTFIMRKTMVRHNTYSSFSLKEKRRLNTTMQCCYVPI